MENYANHHKEIMDANRPFQFGETTVLTFEVDPEGFFVFSCRSFFASLLEKILAVINIPVNVVPKSANCRHPFNIDALPIRVRPAKQNRRCTQKTCNDDCPNSTRGLIAAVFVMG
jgi:hypothetical protein